MPLSRRSFLQRSLAVTAAAAGWPVLDGVGSDERTLVATRSSSARALVLVPLPFGIASRALLATDDYSAMVDTGSAIALTLAPEATLRSGRLDWRMAVGGTAIRWIRQRDESSIDGRGCGCPAARLGRQLWDVAQMLDRDPPPRIYSLTSAGIDHPGCEDQPTKVARAIRSFLSRLELDRRGDRVWTFVFERSDHRQTTTAYVFGRGVGSVWRQGGWITVAELSAAVRAGRLSV
ncbi:MAG: twin-arginine translocation signal domain-containing protein [Thermodesulfobacteriota bacterium]